MPAVKPGGFYFLEDIHTSFMTDAYYNDIEISTVNQLKNVLDGVVDTVHNKGEHPLADVASLILHMDCYPEVCVLERKSA